jgi:peptidoglycan/xylan/chitin deacetylase (PgdA/CDA1 family)
MVDIMNTIIVMYHYVRDNTNFKAFSTEEFREQIDFLSQKRRFITIEELLEEKPKYNTCILTFDDGIKDGFTNAFPILEEYNAKATFFCPSIIFSEKKILQAQKRHLLLAELGTKLFVKEFNKHADDLFKVEDFGIKNEYDDSLTSSLKYVLDTMDQAISASILDTVFKNYFDETEEFNSIYLQKEDIEIMESAGMEIGSHGCRHIHLGNVYYKDMEQDLTDSVTYFKETFDRHPLAMSYPFGSYNVFTKRLIKKLGFKAGINITRQPNTNLQDPFDLNRYDCTCFHPRGTISINNVPILVQS